MTPRISERMNRGLIKPVSDAEIKKAVKAIKSDSSPGIDGMTGQFFQKFWSIVGPQVILEVRSSLNRVSYRPIGTLQRYAFY